MFEVARETSRDSGIRAERNFYSGIIERLQIHLGHLQSGPILRYVRIFLALFNNLSTANDGQGSGLKSRQKKWILQPRKIVGISKQHFVAHKRGDQENTACFHSLHKFIVHGLVTNAVSESINACRKQSLCVAQVKFVSEDAQMLPVRFVDDGLIDGRRNFGAMS